MSISLNFHSNSFHTRQLHSTRILLYYWDGDKHTGFWDDYKGQGEINYKDGTKYKGQWDGDYYRNIKIHGSGILYSVDGQVLNQGNRETFKYKEKE